MGLVEKYDTGPLWVQALPLYSNMTDASLHWRVLHRLLYVVTVPWPSGLEQRIQKS